MTKLMIGGAVGILLVAGQAIASRMPDTPLPEVKPAVDEKAPPSSPVATRTIGRSGAIIDRLDPLASPDPVTVGVPAAAPSASAAVPEPELTEAEAARLAVRQSSDSSSSGFGHKDQPCNGCTRPVSTPLVVAGVAAGAAIIVAATDDSDSD